MKSAQDTLQSVYPQPNIAGITRNYINTTPQTQHNDQFSVVSITRSVRAILSLEEFPTTTAPSLAPGGIPAVATETTNTAWNATVSDSHVFHPNLIGHAQFGFNRYTSNQSGLPLPDSVLSETDGTSFTQAGRLTCCG